MHIYSFDKTGRFVAEPDEASFQKSLIFKLFSDRFFTVLPERMVYVTTNLFFSKDISKDAYYSFSISLDLWKNGVIVFPGLLKVEPNENITMPITKTYTSKISPTDIFDNRVTRIPGNSFLGHLVLYINF